MPPGCLCRWRKGPWVKKCRWPLGAAKGKETDGHLEPPDRNAILLTV